MRHDLDERATMQPAPPRGPFVEVRGASGKLLGYYHPTLHLWKYERNGKAEIVDLKQYQPR